MCSQDICKQATEDRLTSANELPYFEGDFWPNVLEESIKELEQEEEERKREENSTSCETPEVRRRREKGEDVCRKCLRVFYTNAHSIQPRYTKAQGWEEKGDDLCWERLCVFYTNAHPKHTLYTHSLYEHTRRKKGRFGPVLVR